MAGTVTASNVVLALDLTPLAIQTVTITLRSPLGQPIRVTSTNQGINQLSTTLLTDADGAWSATLADLSTLTPSGCWYEFSEPGGKVSTASAADFFAGSLVVSTLYKVRPTLGRLKMALSSLGIGGVDAGSIFALTLDQDAIWSGGTGGNTFVNSGTGFDILTDGNGQAAAYLIRQTELTPNDGVYRRTNTRTQESRTFRVPPFYTGDAGVYSAGTTYAINQVVRRPADDVPFISQTDGNLGNPLTDPAHWAEYAGELITAYEVGTVQATGQLITEIMVQTSHPTPTFHQVPVNARDDLDNILAQIASLTALLRDAGVLPATLNPAISLDKWLPSMPHIVHRSAPSRACLLPAQMPSKPFP